MYPALDRIVRPLFLLFFVMLGVEKAAAADPVQWVDLVFLCLIAAVAASTPVAKLGSALRCLSAVPVIYWACLAISLVVSSSIGASGFKLVQVGYLVAIPCVVQLLVRTRRDLIAALGAWLIGTAVAVAVGMVGLVGFVIAPEGAVYRYVQFHFGTLQPGHYPRISATFFNANMFCAYLTASLGVCVAAALLVPGYRRSATVLGAAIVIVSLFTISPGLGGMALGLGTIAWLGGRRRYPRVACLALSASGAVAVLFVVAASITPIVHPTAPFLIHMPLIGETWAPAGRFLTWTAGWREFVAHPWLGHGIGIDAVNVRYLSPSGELQELTDAHNIYLNIAAQAGLVGLAGLAVVIVRIMSVDKRSRQPGPEGSARRMLCLTFLNVFAYQGLTGSFEDARFLWALLGLILAVDAGLGFPAKRAA